VELDALTNATLPYAAELASRGLEAAIKANAPLGLGVNTYKGKVTYQAVAEAVNLPFAQLSDLLPK
jgi:alanine dehydrogenase